MQSHGRVELVFRPFLRWLDKNMEEMFTEGLKCFQKQLIAEASGVQFIAADELREKYRQSDEGGSSSDEQQEDAGDATDEGESTEGEEPSPEVEQPQLVIKDASLDPNKRGTEVKLHNLQLKESVATLKVTNLALVIQCARCKNTSELTTPPDRTNVIQCSRCQEQQMVAFRGCLVHQFSSVIGYLDLTQCTAFDLMLSECSFVIGCLGCSKDMPMQVRLVKVDGTSFPPSDLISHPFMLFIFQGLPPGSPKDTWCRHCHEKMRIAAESARFLVLQPSNQPTGQHCTCYNITSPYVLVSPSTCLPSNSRFLWCSQSPSESHEEGPKRSCHSTWTTSPS